MKLEKIKSDGFGLKKHDGTISDFAYLSLEIAIKSYASTYSSIAEYDGDFEMIIEKEISNGDTDELYSHNYIKHYTQTIIHLHHFFELILKDALRNEHPLLATDAQDKPAILLKLLRNEIIEVTEEYNHKSIEFSLALKRICILINCKLIDDQYFFLLKHKDFLENLNHIRNRLLHRGTFVLRYQALDWLFIKYALPLIDDITSLKTFVKKMIPFDWKFKPLSCGISGLTEFSRSIKGSNYDLKRVAVIKEMIRAAYENPIVIQYPFGMPGSNTIIKSEDISVPKGNASDNEAITQQAINLANEIYSKRKEFSYGNMVYKVAKCPVCGINSLVIYEDHSDEDQELHKKYNSKVKCTCCSFEIKSTLGDTSIMNLNLENYWQRDLTQ